MPFLVENAFPGHLFPSPALTGTTPPLALLLFFLSPKPAWSAFRQAAYGFGVLSVGGGANKGEAVWRWRRNSDAVGVVADQPHRVWQLQGWGSVEVEEVE
ncbi:unnamed protein product [Closterium sp. Naga37s-1]|nr:unnamed protein product [Closterium sp. Naga37s-1]